MVDTSSRKPCKIAQEEIAAGKVKWTMEAPRSPADVANELLEQAIQKPEGEVEAS